LQQLVDAAWVRGRSQSLRPSGGKFLESSARQPELNQLLHTKMFIVAGLASRGAVPSSAWALGFLLLYGQPFLGLLASSNPRCRRRTGAGME